VTCDIGVATGGCAAVPILDVLDAAAAGGVSGVEIGTPPRHFDLWHDAQVGQVAARLSDRRLHAISLHAPFGIGLDLADPQEAHRRAALDAISTAARVLKRLGGQIVVAHPSDLPRHAHDVSARLHDSAASLQTLSVACHQEGLTLAIESPLPHLVGGHPDEFAWLLQRVDGSAGVCLDTGHTALGRHWHRFLDVSARRLVHVHASDNHGHRDDHLPPGDGVVDWADIARSLAEVQYHGWVMLELGCPADSLPEHFRRAMARSTVLLRDWLASDAPR
jgi:sugar phosphate isomerase/epimerase